MYQLKIKSKSLAAEARIIRLEEKKAKWRRRALVAKGKMEAAKKNECKHYDLYHHRVHDVRKQARATHLAYGFLRKTPYKKIEQFCYTEPNWQEVSRLISKYGQLNLHKDVIDVALEEWKEEEENADYEFPVAAV